MHIARKPFSFRWIILSMKPSIIKIIRFLLSFITFWLCIWANCLSQATSSSPRRRRPVRKWPSSRPSPSPSRLRSGRSSWPTPTDTSPTKTRSTSTGWSPTFRVAALSPEKLLPAISSLFRPLAPATTDTSSCYTSRWKRGFAQKKESQWLYLWVLG